MHESILNAVMNGITLQHAGELFYPKLRPGQSNLFYPNTLFQCLGDFTFCYLCTDSVLVSGNLPAVGGEHPARRLLNEFPGFFGTIETKTTDPPETLLTDPDSRKMVRKALLVFGNAINSSFSYFSEWIQREAATSFGSDDSIYDNNATNYIYGKRPPYMADPELQTVVDGGPIDSLTPSVWEILRNRAQDPIGKTPANRAVRDFISRTMLTHVVIDLWYENLFRRPVQPRAFLLPHVTRAQLAQAAMPQIRRELMPSVLFDVVMETIPQTTKDFIDQLISFRKNSTLYERVRQMLAALMSLDISKREKEVDRILREIKGLRSGGEVSREPLYLNFGNWKNLFDGSMRFKVAHRRLLREVVKPSALIHDPLFSNLYKIFDALDPKLPSDEQFVMYVGNLSMNHSEHHGDNISADGASAVATRGGKVTNTVTNALVNRVKQEHGPETAALIQRVAEVVKQSKNKVAADLWDDFIKRFDGDHCEKATLHRLWDRLLEVLPSIGQIASAATVIGRLFGS